LPKLTARSQVFGANTIQRPAAYLNMTFVVGRAGWVWSENPSFSLRPKLCQLATSDYRYYTLSPDRI